MDPRVIFEVIAQQNIHLSDIFAEFLAGAAKFVGGNVKPLRGILPLYPVFFAFSFIFLLQPARNYIVEFI